MPDIKKYKSVSVSLASSEQLKKIQKEYRELYGVTFSMAKLIESLATEKAKTLQHQPPSTVNVVL